MFWTRAVTIKDRTDFKHETIFKMAEVKPFVKSFILGVIELSMIRQDFFVVGKPKLSEGLFSVSSLLLANSSLFMFSESSLDECCSSLKEKQFKKFYNTLWVFVFYVHKENLQFQS